MTTKTPIQIVYNEKTSEKIIDINIIKSPMKFEIINLLRQNEMNFEEIVENTSKSKATVSMHLKSLREEGIVNYKADPKDNRKRIFYLSADLIGSIDASKSKNTTNQTKILIDKFIDEGNIEYVFMFVHLFKSVLIDYGIDINPIFETIGKNIASYLYKELYDENLEKFAENIVAYWHENNLGELSFDIKNNIQITCKDCFECLTLQKTGEPMCYLEKGMFEKLFSNYFSFEIKALEIKCYSMGDEACVFELEP